MIAVAIQSCVASTLVNEGCSILDGCDGPPPSAREMESREPGVDSDVTTDAFDGTVELEDRIQIQIAGHGMIAPPGEARGAMDTSCSTPRGSEDPYPGNSRLNTLARASASSSRGRGA